MPKSQELMVLYNALDVTGGDKIAGNLRDSDWDAFSVDWKWQMESRQEHCTWAVIPELDFGSRGPEGRITGTTNTARGPAVIPAVAVAAERQYGRLDLLLEPKLAWFGDNWDNSGGGSTPAFGTVLTLGAGARYPGLGGFFAGDVSAVLAGDNAVSQNTGLLKPTPVWSLSWTEVLQMHGDPAITIFLANTVGPCLAESMIGTPGAALNTGTGGGARVTGYF